MMTMMTISIGGGIWHLMTRATMDILVEILGDHSTNVFFLLQEKLFNVMKAYSVHDREVGWKKHTNIVMMIALCPACYIVMIILQVLTKSCQGSSSHIMILSMILQVGYCQGSAFIVGLLLMQVSNWIIISSALIIILLRQVTKSHIVNI